MKSETILFLGIATAAVVGGVLYYNSQKKKALTPPPATINPNQRNPNTYQQQSEITGYINAGIAALDAGQRAFGF